MTIEIPFKQDTLAQIHLSQAGGSIAIKASGKVVFQFSSQESYMEYSKLQKEGMKHEPLRA